MAIEVRLGDAAVERADARLAVDVDARGAAADRVDPRQVRSGAADRVVDALEVVGRVLLEVRIPLHLVREHHLAVDDGRRLAVAAAEVEADPAALQVPSERPLRLLRARQRARRPDLDRRAEHAPAEEVAVEGARALRGVERPERASDGRGAAHEDRRAALLPQQELDQALDVAAVERRVRRALRQDPRLVREDGPVLPQERQPERNTARPSHRGVVRASPQRGGQELRVDLGPVADFDVADAGPSAPATLRNRLRRCQGAYNPRRREG